MVKKEYEASYDIALGSRTKRCPIKRVAGFRAERYVALPRPRLHEVGMVKSDPSKAHRTRY